MAIGAGILFGLAFLWPAALVPLRAFKDIPIGGVNIRATGDDYIAGERRTIEAQNRMYRFWVRLWPIAVMCLLAAIILLALST
jgi:hypothetical protein